MSRAETVPLCVNELKPCRHDRLEARLRAAQEIQCDPTRTASERNDAGNKVASYLAWMLALKGKP